jgi:tetratricopeptide (TPR) repeat protein
MRSYEDLENGLKKLGYDKEIMLVAHSYGGHLATLYAVKHPDLVKSVVLIDVTGNFFSRNAYLEEELKDISPYLPQMKTSKPAQYNIYINLGETAQLMKTYSIPSQIPVIDIMRESPGFNEKEKNQFWYDCHKEFAAAHPKSRSITAYECQHHIWFDNPGMVVQIISKMYEETLKSKDSAKIYERLADYGITLSNEVKKHNTLYNHSEDNLNSWGYELLNKGELLKALEIFKLNVTLYPNSFNVYDSYGEALLKNNQKEEAIFMYKKSIELNPGNENRFKVLKTLLK